MNSFKEVQKLAIGLMKARDTECFPVILIGNKV
jgi:hypothetical protein